MDGDARLGFVAAAPFSTDTGGDGGSILAGCRTFVPKTAEARLAMDAAALVLQLEFQVRLLGEACLIASLAASGTFCSRYGRSDSGGRQCGRVKGKVLEDKLSIH